MDINLYYREAGAGVPFIFLHGNGEDSTYFENQIEFFSKDYHVYAIDTRGHGKSNRGSVEFTIKQFSLDLYDFMNEKGLESAIILGFSDGANIATEFTIKHQDRVKALILNGGNIYPSGMKSLVFLSTKIMYGLFRIFSKVIPGFEKKAELYSLMVNEPFIEPKELNKITVPTLVVAGKNDMIKESHTKEIAKNIPGSKLEILAGDHFVANKKPDSFNKVVNDFLINCEKINRKEII